MAKIAVSSDSRQDCGAAIPPTDVYQTITKRQPLDQGGGLADYDID